MSKKKCIFARDFCMNETICAISTPYGVGGIAVIRVSGAQSIAIVDRLFCGRIALREAKAGTVHFGKVERVRELESEGVRELENEREVLDEVLCSVFKAPHSFTGEDTVEIMCHGSLYIQQTLIQWLVDAGCRIARPGEFTQRAFVNGKMDLAQAEAVADLIAAQSKAEKDLALSQLRGSVSNELGQLRERLLHLTSLLELELDFADHEELEFADRTELSALANEIETKLAALRDSFRTGNAIRHGVSVAIVGAPNVGKSTLLNALLGEQRAIVSDIQGTTRDTVEDTMVLDGVLFRLIDTAGLRETSDTIENMGIERTLRAAQEAQIVVHVTDDNSVTGCSCSNFTWIASKTHCTAFDYTFLILHKIDYRMFAHFVKLAAVCIFITKNASCKFNYGNLHTKTDSKIWKFMSTCIAARADHSFYATVSKSTRQNDSGTVFENFWCCSICYTVTVYPFDFDILSNDKTCVVQCFDNTQI